MNDQNIPQLNLETELKLQSNLFAYFGCPSVKLHKTEHL